MEQLQFGMQILYGEQFRTDLFISDYISNGLWKK